MPSPAPVADAGDLRWWRPWIRQSTAGLVWLVVTMLCLGFLYVVNSPPFLGAAQIIVYTDVGSTENGVKVRPRAPRIAKRLLPARSPLPRSRSP